VDVAPNAGIAESTTTYGADVADFRGDGNQDFFLSTFTDGPAQLWISDGANRFGQVDAGTFVQSDRHDCAAADVAGNGLLDVFCPIGADHGNGFKTNQLYMQGTGLSFSDQAAAYGVLDPLGRGRVATFLDVNNDGRPDLFVGMDPFRADGLPGPNRLFINTGSGFVDAPSYGLDRNVGAVCAHAADYNQSGYESLLICPAEGPVKLYENIGGTHFVDVTTAAGIPRTPIVGAQWADLNGDGLPDLVLCSTTKLMVLLQNPNHTFAQSFSMPLTSGADVGVGDVTGDGVQDVYVVQSASGGINQPDLMLLNNGPGTNFTEMSIPETTLGSGDSVYPIDFEHNGLTDFLVLNGSGLTKQPGPVQLIVFFPGPLAPALTLVKSASASSYSVPGTPITYSYYVDNTGNVILDPITVTDPMVGLSPVTCPVQSLAPGDAETCSASYITTQADLDAGSITNTATASGTPPSGTAVTARSTVTVPA
jgi:hypothetical protein